MFWRSSRLLLKLCPLRNLPSVELVGLEEGLSENSEPPEGDFFRLTGASGLKNENKKS